MIRVLGLSASLRSARHGRGAEELPQELQSIADRDALTEYLKHETHDLLEAFEEGRKQDLPFDELYAELKKRKGLRGLSNSEASVAAGLWGAQQEGADVRYVDLQRFFPDQMIHWASPLAIREQGTELAGRPSGAFMNANSAGCVMACSVVLVATTVQIQRTRVAIATLVLEDRLLAVRALDAAGWTQAKTTGMNYVKQHATRIWED